MVTYSGGPAPKRRRTDGPPTAQQVADTNRTLQAFTGGRQNRWLQRSHSDEEGATARAGQTEAMARVSLDKPAAHGKEATAGASERRQEINASASADNASLPAVTMGERQALSEPITEPVAVVEYESPFLIDRTTTALQKDQFSEAALRSGPQPGLPSPAPSVEHQSPASINLARNSIPPARKAAGRKGTGSRYSFGKTATDNTTPAQSPQLPIAALSGSGAMYNPTMHGSNMDVRQSSAISTPPVLRLNATHQSPHQLMQPSQRTLQPTGPNYYLQYNMQRHFDQFWNTYRLPINSYESGRKTLLQDAINRNDFFYLILSQIFCLRSHSPTYVPETLSRLPPSFGALERLLCSNKDINPQIVAWFAEFPAPLHLIYSSETSAAFMQCLDMIQRFLIRLPQAWPGLLEESKRCQAPPLAQEMVEILQLTSPVLQMTAFRAIARLFWADNDSRGLQVLEGLHRLDQDTYFSRGWRRTETEKCVARNVYVTVYRSFVEWCRSGKQPGAYPMPAEAAYLYAPPPSMMCSAGSAASASGLVGLQHHQMNEVNSGALARQQQQHHHHHRYVQYVSPSASRVMSAAPVNTPYVPPAPSTSAHWARVLPGDTDAPQAQPVNPNTMRMALHQGHLRSPVPGPRARPPGAQPLYRHVIGYALDLTQINSKLQVQQLTFTITQGDFHKIPKTEPPESEGKRGKRLLDTSSYLYRLRCSRIAESGFQTENSWITAENVWPDNLSFALNGQHLEPRLKLHHGRYLPVDVTPHLAEGANTLDLYLARRTDDLQPFEYAVAVEVIGVSSHSSILSSVPTLSSSDSLAAIRQSLAGSADDDNDDDDDDLVMTSNFLTIGLFDPFTNDRICKTPVRGSACLHKDCFDLETFLSQCKREKPGYPSVVDCWRCPICRFDVRPQTLLKDGFLMQVRDELEKQGLLHTRSIVVDAQGSWRAKEEEKGSGVRSASLEVEEEEQAMGEIRQKAKVKQKHKHKQIVEVIELD